MIGIRDSNGVLWMVSVNTDGTLQTTEAPGANNPSNLCSITLQDTVNWARTFTKLIPIVGVGGFSNQPALTICNSVIQEMLSAPHNWKFNRGSLTFDTVEYQQDYTVACSDMGWLENAVIEDKDSTQTVKPLLNIDVVADLTKTSELGSPAKVCYRPVDSSNVILRVHPVPYAYNWTLYTDYQKKPPLKVTLVETWSPIPDEYSYIYQQGFLAFAKKHANDPDWVREYQIFQAMIGKGLGRSDMEQDDSTFCPARALMIG